jgi:hypothetical protein
VHFDLRAQIAVALGCYFDPESGWQQSQKSQLTRDVELTATLLLPKEFLVL